MWEHDNLNSAGVTKLEATDMMEYIDPNMSSPNTTTLSPLNHQHNSNRDYHYQTSQYLTPLPPLGNDPYSPSECQMLDSFQCIGNMDSAFHKCKSAQFYYVAMSTDGNLQYVHSWILTRALNSLPIVSESSLSYSESYDSFIPEMSPQEHQVHPHQLQQHHQQLLSHLPQTHHHHNQSHQGHGQDLGHHHQSLQSFSLSNELSGLSHHNPTSHHDYMWDELGCDPTGEYLFLRKGDSPTTSGQYNIYNLPTSQFRFLLDSN